MVKFKLQIEWSLKCEFDFDGVFYGNEQNRLHTIFLHQFGKIGNIDWRVLGLMEMNTFGSFFKIKEKIEIRNVWKLIHLEEYSLVIYYAQKNLRSKIEIVAISHSFNFQKKKKLIKNR